MPKSTRTRQSTTTRTRARASTQPQASSPAPPSITLNHADIATRAYELFLAGGAQHGRDLDHWLQAESELRNRALSAGQ